MLAFQWLYRFNRMAKLEPKLIQKELDQGKVRPAYYLFGPERMKARELLKRIQKTVLGDDVPNDFNFERWEGSEVGAETVLDSIQSFSLMGGTKLVLVRNADELDRLELLADHLKGAAPEVDGSVLVLMARSFDGRKKVFKAIEAGAVVVECASVADEDREPWIDYLAKRREVRLSAEERLALAGLDPWSLELVDQEIAKLELVGDDAGLRAESLLSGVDVHAKDEFIEGILSRNRSLALKHVHLFHQDMDVQLPILGLIAWNFRQLKCFWMEKHTRARSGERRNPYLQAKLDRWVKVWNQEHLHEFEQELFDLDFALKNTRATGEGLWAQLILGHSIRGAR